MSFETDRAFWGDETPLPPTTTNQERRAAIRAADYVAGQYAHLTGAQLATDPIIHAGLRELLAALGLQTSKGNPNA
ncbi:hypothetical protein [Streptomyces sp. NRRL B-24720]|uniref:hypothetical protein n=1 Tax=Streptomyces sp. NRRL B-24720 TaxID=1476876 RepID=UPI0004C75A6B|nr:hypothetical protein [Streptomyces sp. NRRL B-24720]